MPSGLQDLQIDDLVEFYVVVVSLVVIREHLYMTQ